MTRRTAPEHDDPPRIATLTLNPALDVHLRVDAPRLGRLNRASTVRYAAAGKGLNVSLALARQGTASTAVLPLGGPIAGAIATLLEAEAIDVRRVPIGGETRVNTKVVDAGGALSELNAPGAPLGGHELDACLSAFEAALAPGGVAVLGGSLPPGVPDDVYAELTRRLTRRGVLVVVDASGAALSSALAAAPALVKPNRDEAEALLGEPLRTLADAARAAARLAERGVPRVVISLGADGAAFHSAAPDDAGTVVIVPPEVEVGNPAGAGDALVAGVVVGLTQGWRLERLARFATALAAARAAGDGTRFPDRAAVEALQGQVEIVAAEAWSRPLRSR